VATPERRPPKRFGFGASGPTLAEVGEAELLRQLVAIAREGPGSSDLIVPAGDDAAVWRPPPGREVVVSQDAIVEGEDFERSWIDPETLGERALQVALSDLAAMGAEPCLCTATLCAPGTTPLADVLALQRGLSAAAAAAGCALAGGDVSAITGPLVVDVTVVGIAAPGGSLRRDAGRPGDLLLVTGELGGASAGLRLLLGEVEAPPEVAERWRARQLRPAARLQEGVAMARRGVRCAGDLSDGLAVDSARIVEASGCGAELWLDRIPADPDLRAILGAGWTEAAIGGGEDFELLCAVPAPQVCGLLGDWPAELAPLSVVGRLVSAPGLHLLASEGGAAVALPAVRSRHFTEW
jgi:thiamine-monophosphate kinase